MLGYNYPMPSSPPESVVTYAYLITPGDYLNYLGLWELVFSVAFLYDFTGEAKHGNPAITISSGTINFKGRNPVKIIRAHGIPYWSGLGDVDYVTL